MLKKQPLILEMVWLDLAKDFFVQVYKEDITSNKFQENVNQYVANVEARIKLLLPTELSTNLINLTKIDLKTDLNNSDNLIVIQDDLKTIFEIAANIKTLIDEELKRLNLDTAFLKEILEIKSIKGTLCDPDNKSLMVATSPPIRTGLRSLLLVHEWMTNHKTLAFSDQYQNGGRQKEFHKLNKDEAVSQPNGVTVRLIDKDKRFFTIEKALELLDTFGEYTAYLHLYVTALALSNPNPSRDKFYVSGITLLKDLGLYDRLKNQQRDDDEILRELEHNMFLMGSFHVDVRWKDVQYRKGKRVPVDLGCSGQLWSVDVLEKFYKDENNKLIKEITFAITPREWAEKFLCQEAYINNEGINQYGYLSLAILKISPFQDPLAFRIALYLGIESRIKNGDCYTFYEILRCYYSDHDLNLLEKGSPNYDREKARKVKDKLLKTFQILIKLGYEIAIQDPKYSKCDLTSNHWLVDGVGKLLRIKLTLKQPKETTQKLEAIRQSPLKPENKSTLSAKTISPSSKELPPSPPQSFSKDDLKALRIKLGLTQSALAIKLKVSQGAIALYENGKRSIPKKLIEELKKLDLS